MLTLTPNYFGYSVKLTKVCVRNWAVRTKRLYSNDVEQIASILKVYNKKRNVPENILSKVGRNLHLKLDHPLCLTKNM